MRPCFLTQRSPSAGKFLTLLLIVMLVSLRAQADLVYTLHATSPSGDMFDGTITTPTTPPPPLPYPFTDFTGQITQTTASGTILTTYVGTASEVIGTTRGFFFDEANNQYGGLVLFVQESAFLNNLTVCTLTHPCDCGSADQCFLTQTTNIVTEAARCTDLDPNNLPAGCYAYDVEQFQAATLTSAPLSATPEPFSLGLLTTGLALLPSLARRRRTSTLGR